MREIDVNHMGRERVICCYELGDGVIIDPGPQSSERTLIEALGGEAPRAIVLTHIHLDHAGATGSLVRRWPDTPVYVHERGAPHLLDPSRLWASASQLWPDDMDERWGEAVPVPEENINLVGEGDSIFGMRVAYTPGHASHHVSYLHEDSGVAFVGDMAGVRIPPYDLTLAPTPPPDIDVEAWERSLDTIAAWEPQALALTHFGTADDPPTQLAAVREALRWQAEVAASHDLEGFMAALHERIAERAPDEVDAAELAAPLDHLYLGLDRWRRKRDDGRP